MIRLLKSTLTIVLLTTQTVSAIGPVQGPKTGRSANIRNAIVDDQTMSEVQFEDVAIQRGKDGIIRRRRDTEGRLWSIPQDVNGIKVTAETIANYSRFFDNIIVINKSEDMRPIPMSAFGPEPQKLSVYRFGQLQDNFRTIEKFNKRTQEKTVEKVERFKTSTGTEKYTCEVSTDDTGMPVAFRTVWTGTPTGFFVSEEPRIDWHSRSYDNSHMQYAFMFIKRDGVGTHLGSEPQFFGKARRSHGCVRLTQADARQIFMWSLLSGGPVNYGDPNLQGDCSPKQLALGEDCRGRAAAVTPGYRAEIRHAIQVSLAEGRNLPYSEVPRVPVLDQAGNFLAEENGALDADQGIFAKMPGYKTLVIVQCVDRDGADCSKIECMMGDTACLKSRRGMPFDPQCSGDIAAYAASKGMQVSTKPVVNDGGPSLFGPGGLFGGGIFNPFVSRPAQPVQPPMQITPQPQHRRVQSAPQPRRVDVAPRPSPAPTSTSWPDAGDDE